MRILLAAIAMWALPALADQPLTIVETRHRSAEALVEQLRPLLSPDGRISAINDKLLIRTDPRNLGQLRDALAALDVAARRLRISLRSSQSAASEHASAGIGGEIRGGDGSVRVRIGRSRIASSGEGEQFVNTVEGGHASLFVGRAVPLRFDEVHVRPDGARVVRGTIWREVGDALVARPTVIGERVRVVLSPEHSRQRSDGSVEIMRLESTVEGRLGEWIPVGGSSAEGTRERGVIGATQSLSSSTDAAFWLRVDLDE